MDPLISPEIEKSLAGKFLKFSEDGLLPTLRVVSVEYVDADDPKFGNDDGKRYIVTFEDDQVLTSTSRRLIRAIKDAKIVSGDCIQIARIGTGFETRYRVTKIDEN